MEENSGAAMEKQAAIGRRPSRAQVDEIIEFSGEDVLAREWQGAETLAEPVAEGVIQLVRIGFRTFYSQQNQFLQGLKVRESTIMHLAVANRRSLFKDSDDYLVFTLRYPLFDRSRNSFIITSASLLIFPRRIVLIEPNTPSSIFETVIGELTEPAGVPVRRRSLAGIALHLINAVVGVYSSSLEEFGNVLNHFEEEVIGSNGRKVLAMMALVRRQNIFLQQTILPLKEMTFELQHADSTLIDPELYSCLHSVSEHILQIIDSAGMLSQINAGLIDIYSSAQANRMNDIMRLLTIFSVLAIPLTVVSGFYGMNFVHIPGLHRQYGVLWALGAMVVWIIGLIWYFRRKKLF